MNDLQMAMRQVRYEQKVFWRTPATVFFGFALPVGLLVIFCGLYADVPQPEYFDVRFVEYFVPAMLAFGMVSMCYGSVASRYVYRREAGLLMRVRASPLSLRAMLSGYIANAVIVATIVVFLITFVGVAFYDVPLPTRWAAFALVLLVGAITFCCVGLAVATFIPHLEAADAIIYGTLLPFMFISGAFNAVDPDSLVGHIAAVFPVRHLVDGWLAVFDPRHSEPAFPWVQLGLLAVWAVAGAGMAAIRFRWAPAR